MKDIIKNIIRNVEIELLDEFNKNFERGGFFTQKWAEKWTGEPSNLTRTGRLSRSIRTMTTENSINFTSSEPYAAIHNYGGTIRVTKKMNRFFWAQYYLHGGGKKKNTPRMAQYYKNLALKKEGSTITIPQRQFIGWSPEVKENVEDIIKNNVREGIIIKFKHLSK